MLILSGNNLGERHRDLNSKVDEAAKRKLDFEEVKSRDGNCDVDKLFKIDLASRYKHTDYILEVLKCGDTFYITRALKCLWLYDDEYSEYIKTDYLKTNIFPYMSMKMKRKTLTAISIHLKNGERAIDFYTYCRDEKMIDYACKFLFFTPDKYKLEIMTQESNLKCLRDEKSIRHFIGNSFELAEAYIVLRGRNSYGLHQLRFLYAVSNEKYLDILEKYNSYDITYYYPHYFNKLGLRASKDILKKHLNRVIKCPVLYINILNKNMLIMLLTAADVKSLAFSLLPRSSDNFWSMDFYRTYQFLFQKLPKNELFYFLIDIFTSKYPNESFEMSLPFYQRTYYEMLTLEEKETWALLHIERDEEWAGIENFTWYRFVSFGKAFDGIKRYIFLTPDKDKRSCIVNILPETARNQDDLTKILTYYYDRHVNESEEHKVSFISKVMELHDIYSFETDCWMALEKLFYSIELYTSESQMPWRPSDNWWGVHNHSSISNKKFEFRIRSMFYYILHSKELPELLKEYIDCANYENINSIIDHLSRERNTIIATFLINYYVDKIKYLMEKQCNEIIVEDEENIRIKDEIDIEVKHVWHVINCFRRDHEECPEVVLQHMEKNEEENKEEYESLEPKFIKKTEGDFLRLLKQDVQKAVDGISEIRCNAYRREFRLCRVFRKLKIYFLTDVGCKYLEFFKEYLSHVPKSRREYRNIKMAVVAIFHLADEDFKVNFMEQYVPENAKIDHMNIDNVLLQVQKAICRLAYHSRPPLPLSNVLKYMKGDYVHYCLPVFNYYFANSTSITNFIESVLDAPLSLQKHGLRLAFKTYSPKNLKPLILSVWKKTKNVSLRMLLYETLFNRIVNETKEAQNHLYEVLKLYTSELKHDDHDNLYSLLVSSALPDEFKGDFIETAWITTNKLSNKAVDINRRISVIRQMEQYMHLVQREFPRQQIIDKHVEYMIHMKNIQTPNCDFCSQQLIEAKWNLTAKYIVSFRNEEEQLRSLELLQTILTSCFELWNYVNNNVYIIRIFIYGFMKMIKNKDPYTVQSCGDMIPIYQCILDNFQKTLKYEKRYLLTWELELSITLRKIIHDRMKTVGDEFNSIENINSKEVASLFGKEVGNIVVNLIDKGQFYRCFYQTIASTVSATVNTLCHIFPMDSHCIIYYVSEGLIDIKISETHIIALLMLPNDPSDVLMRKEHRTVIEKIKKFNCKEVCSFLYDKYSKVSNFYVRDFLKH